MHANVEDRGIKGECTPLMEAASAGHLDIVRLLVAHGADVNAQSTSGKFILISMSYFFLVCNRFVCTKLTQFKPPVLVNQFISETSQA